MSSGLVIAERVDIHKSCKSVELVVNLLNDYCQVANALVALQKKLAKALRDAASTKATASIPASALLTTATIFEGLSEVDSKFVKLADRECDSISTEVRKWFKKLAKEEKVHDEKIANANAKIKQAGQLYEKKAKKSPRDAQEEHTRYITLVSVLGPEVSQDKYNHSLSVTKRHTSLLHGVAAALSRVADAEWLRSCEQVRRSAPSIGQLGEWRSLCEGGWSGPVPPDLPSIDPLTAEASEKQGGELTTSLEKPAPEYSSRGPSEQERTQLAQDGTTVKTSTLTSPPPQYSSPKLQSQSSDTSQTKDRPRADTTLASLASFPAPPTHFPLPPVTPTSSSSPLTISNPHPADDHRTYADTSPISLPVSSSESHTTSIPASPGLNSSRESTSVEESSGAKHLTLSSQKPGQQESRDLPPSNDQETRTASAGPLFGDGGPLTDSPNPSVHLNEQGTQEDMDTSEFGTRRRDDVIRQSRDPARVMERTDTGKSSGSVVAALRDRYARTPGSSVPSPKEVVRLPLSVSSLATRYDTSGSIPSSPRSSERRRLSTDLTMKTSAPSSPDRAITLSSVKAILPPNDASTNKQRAIDVEGQRLYERERQIRQREQDVERQARELESERLRIQRDAGISRRSVDFPSGDYAPSPRPPAQLPPSLPLFHQLHSYSATNLATHIPNATTPYVPRASPHHSPSIGTIDHAPSCGCETCSASKYRTRDVYPSSHNLRPPEPPLTLRPEKPKGWIRRLSMPVMGNAFSSDSKKGITNLAITGSASTGQYRNSLAMPDEDGHVRFDIVGNRNRSTATLGR